MTKSTRRANKILVIVMNALLCCLTYGDILAQSPADSSIVMRDGHRLMRFKNDEFDTVVYRLASYYGMRVENPFHVKGKTIHGTFDLEDPLKDQIDILQHIEGDNVCILVEGDAIVVGPGRTRYLNDRPSRTERIRTFWVFKYCEQPAGADLTFVKPEFPMSVDIRDDQVVILDTKIRATNVWHLDQLIDEIHEDDIAGISEGKEWTASRENDTCRMLIVTMKDNRYGYDSYVDILTGSIEHGTVKETRYLLTRSLEYKYFGNK